LNDGPDSFFIEAAPAADVTEPGSLAIMGTGLLGFAGIVGWTRRRRHDGTDAVAV
jgi:LPXTG-motif cell wall-anchored protein